MGTEERVRSLERKHAELEKQLADRMSCAGAKDQELIELKKSKLALKDEIERLRAATSL